MGSLCLAQDRGEGYLSPLEDEIELEWVELPLVVTGGVK